MFGYVDENLVIICCDGDEFPPHATQVPNVFVNALLPLKWRPICRSVIRYVFGPKALFL